jgi:hypothetical protein
MEWRVGVWSGALGQARRELIMENISREKKSVVVDRVFEEMTAKGENITPEVLLKKAKMSKHPLHSFFEWDDSVAGEKYRKAQALDMIMASKFVIGLRKEVASAAFAGKPVEVRKYLPDFHNKGDFKLRTEVMDDAECRQHYIEKKVEILRTWLRETVDVPELSVLRKTIEVGIAKLSD